MPRRWRVRAGFVSSYQGIVYSVRLLLLLLREFLPASVRHTKLMNTCRSNESPIRKIRRGLCCLLLLGNNKGDAHHSLVWKTSYSGLDWVVSSTTLAAFVALSVISSPPNREALYMLISTGQLRFQYGYLSRGSPSTRKRELASGLLLPRTLLLLLWSPLFVCSTAPSLSTLSACYGWQLVLLLL
jgi:hypothetical protein